MDLSFESLVGLYVPVWLTSSQPLHLCRAGLALTFFLFVIARISLLRTTDITFWKHPQISSSDTLSARIKLEDADSILSYVQLWMERQGSKSM